MVITGNFFSFLSSSSNIQYFRSGVLDFAKANVTCAVTNLESPRTLHQWTEGTAVCKNTGRVYAFAIWLDLVYRGTTVRTVVFADNLFDLDADEATTVRFATPTQLDKVADVQIAVQQTIDSFKQ